MSDAISLVGVVSVRASPCPSSLTACGRPERFQAVTSDETREAAMILLRRGEATMSEVARLVGVTPQSIAEWCARDGLDTKAARAEWLHRRWVAESMRLAGRPVKKRTKAEQRKLAAWATSRGVKPRRASSLAPRAAV